MKPLQVGLAAIYFAYAAFFLFEIVGGFEEAMQPNTYVALYPAVFGLVIFVGLWATLGYFELRGLHWQNMAGSIISMMMVLLFFVFQDGHSDATGIIELGLFCVLPIVALVDLMSLSGSRAFASVLSVDSFLLILLSLANYYASPTSDVIRGSPQLQGLVGLTAGASLLVYGVFRLIRPGKSPNPGEGVVAIGEQRF